MIKWYKCITEHSQKIHPALKRFPVFKLQKSPYKSLSRNNSWFIDVKFDMACLINFTFSVVMPLFNQNPIGKNLRSLFCVFLPPSSREIQLHIHAFWIRHHICSRSPIRMQKRTASCATVRTEQRKSRTEESSLGGKIRSYSEEQGKTGWWCYSPPIRR